MSDDEDTLESHRAALDHCIEKYNKAKSEDDGRFYYRHCIAGWRLAVEKQKQQVAKNKEHTT